MTTASNELLLISENGRLRETLRTRYPHCKLRCAASLLEGIDSLADGIPRAVVLELPAGVARLSDAIRGLREASGQDVPVLICCPPESEPQARRALEAGATDYLIQPLDVRELDVFLGFGHTPAPPRIIEDAPAASMEELARLGYILSDLGCDGLTLLQRLAELVQVALQADSVTLVAEGTAATAGKTVVDPVLAEGILRNDQPIGQIMVGSRAWPYDHHDIDKLRHYARLISHLLAAAHTQHDWQRAAWTDEVSGLHNRRYLLEQLPRLLERAHKERFRVTLLLFDIDDFKHYNDTYGHAAGDEIINVIGQLFRKHSREHDIVTRYGGDEFAVVFWDADEPRVAGSRHPSDAISVLRRFRAALRTCDCKTVGNLQGRLTISGGLASFPWDAAEASELIEKADQALLKAKQAGKNQIFAFGTDADCADPAAG